MSDIDPAEAPAAESSRGLAPAGEPQPVGVDERAATHDDDTFKMDMNDEGGELAPQETLAVDDLLAEEAETGTFMQKLTKRMTKRKADRDSKAASGKDDAPDAKPIKYRELFRYADRYDKICIFFGFWAAACHGACMPLFTIIFGDVIDQLGETEDPTAYDPAVFLNQMRESAIWFVVIGSVAFVFATFQVGLFMFSSARQGNRIRKKYVHGVFAQEMSYFDAHESGELTSRVAGDVGIISSGFGDKLGSFIQFYSTFFVGIIIGFVYGWKLTLVILSTTPLLALSGALFAKFSADATVQGQQAYASAGAIAEEVFSLIRTVVAFGGEEREMGRYNAELSAAYKTGVKRAALSGAAIGLTMFIIFASYGLGFWYGNELVQRGEMTAGRVLTVFFSVVIGSMGLGQGAPALTAFAAARGAAPRVFEMIERQPQIDNFSTEGEILDSSSFQGDVEFRDVKFTYVSRPDELILKGMSFKVNPGQTLAFVGQSGCGKSTSIGLIERFYDVLDGQVLMGGKDVRSINVQSLRSQIGLVSQMPTLFAASIRENIALGAGFEMVEEKDETGSHGTRYFRRREVSFEQVQEAAKKANAHEFIMRMPEQYDTVLGQRGALLSGGQKQRVAIARALVRDPKILLLDEATSALDTKSEKTVQAAIETAAKGRTTVVIAHRLSTVRHADIIAVVDAGQIVESGSHDELMKLPEGRYRAMVQAQQIQSEEDAKKMKGRENADEDFIDRSATTATDEDEHHHEALAAAYMEDGAGGATKTSTHASDKESLMRAIEEGADQDSSAEAGKPAVDKNVGTRALKLNTEEWYIIAAGILGAILNGSSFPVFALIFTELVVVLTQSDNSSDVAFWSCMFVVIGAGTWIALFLQVSMFGWSGELLTRRVRSLSFAAIVRQDMAFFDHRDHTVGALSTMLASDANSVRNLAGESLGAAAASVTTIAVGVALAFTGCWKLAFVVLAFVPAMAVAQVLQIKLMTGFSEKSDKQFAHAGRIASEAVDNIRTITSLGVGEHFYELYREELKGPSRDARKSAMVTGIAFGFSVFIQFAIWSVSFYYGSLLIDRMECSFTGVMRAITALLFAAMQLGQVSATMPDMASAKVAATRVFQLVDRKPEIDAFSDEGRKLDSVSGDVEFDEVKFEYPTRKEVPVLRGLSVSIDHGQTLAFVGESGCGKSTTIGLVERFYDYRSGTIKLDGVPLTDLNVRWLRSQIGIVSQEPDLFNTTIRENILYGFSKEDMTIVTDDQVEKAAELANAVDFIRRLPHGFDEPVGERGSKLSGGQRQRIAIARALVRNPKILLLDEATSALDSRSERVVQDALNRASKGRTTLVIAHRLSTIADSEKIAVVRSGRSRLSRAKSVQVYCSFILTRLSRFVVREGFLSIHCSLAQTQAGPLWRARHCVLRQVHSVPDTELHFSSTQTVTAFHYRASYASFIPATIADRNGVSSICSLLRPCTPRLRLF
ncbi:Multidrug resistance protein 1B [Porphyridium purpureum]|uniref:Probable ATP-dependent transporter ycf16 n=1 Tax=Porphyridium purpureum TaxID=35688 RepID=A0A5J4YUB6_PORPP|nr:Multidrug resistance protein 1B [Porphyridium purpureum]|eukprot:POR1584..scf227_4